MNKARLLTQEQSELLRTSIAQPQPCCTGTVQVSPKDLVIYYGKDENAKLVCLITEAIADLTTPVAESIFSMHRRNHLSA